MDDIALLFRVCARQTEPCNQQRSTGRGRNCREANAAESGLPSPRPSPARTPPKAACPHPGPLPLRGRGRKSYFLEGFLAGLAGALSAALAWALPPFSSLAAALVPLSPLPPVAGLGADPASSGRSSSNDIGAASPGRWGSFTIRV